jgi:hypothetical protein
MILNIPSDYFLKQNWQIDLSKAKVFSLRYELNS